MDSRADLIFLLMLIAQAACAPANKEGPLNESAKEIRKDVWTMVEDIAAMVPNISCLHLNLTELGGPEQKLLAGHHLSSFRCYLAKVSSMTPVLQKRLDTTGQHLKSMEEQLSGQTADRDCSLPQFKQHLDQYVYAKCLLQHLDQRLSKATFDFTA